MIILLHKKNKVVEVIDSNSNLTLEILESNPTKALFVLASKYNNSIICWAHYNYKNSINIKKIKSFFFNTNTIVSTGNKNYLSNAIGYVEDSVFINVNKTVKYPTWLMHSNCGAIYANNLLKFKPLIKVNQDFTYNLNSIAKLGINNGLYCYASPGIIKNQGVKPSFKTASKFKLFQFVKEHYKARWVFLLFINFLIHERKILILPFLKSFLYKRKHFNNLITSENKIKKLEINETVSVIIPTIGRATYLYNVLKDLALQTLKPKEVIIIEQNNNEVLKTELNYLKTENWPFKIIHKLISQTGACNARNIALDLVSSNYTFFADDDIRFNKNILNNAIHFMHGQGHDAITLSCLRENEIEKQKTSIQWNSFGSGCSIVKSNVIRNLKFNMAFEHGFGEDTDFGMQLRNNGVDIIYLPSVQLKHLKAPVGGFRKKHIHEWEKQDIIPKPSPTIMLFLLKYKTKQQLKSYKLTLFLKYYKKQTIKNPITYFKNYKKRWALSKVWAEQLNNSNF
ncbi:glycosyltransferase family 2 protein [Lacinutrix sp. MedPE-SW]|uniref:glycosyltransferase family 2 protein n=1 Tax=Lacinutrix sp. MedPE-SW TaxID=1860087 RepID=UPI000918D63C|nr:glycosyltransferase family A protein [Lacinutrix sp. MedPE-SW]OIQ22710.1 MAG: hypothetical protein BM549_06420 [Lacinutrix sp. MedPE-SW]